MSNSVFSGVTSAKRQRSAGVAALCLMLMIGFGFISTETGCGASLGTECTLTSDCDYDLGLHCIYGMCVQQCDQSEDCTQLDLSAICVHAPVPDDDELRLEGITTINACQKPEVCGDANGGGTCMDGQICQGNRCLRKCSAQEPCPGTDKCYAGACHPATVVADSGPPPQSETGEYCEINSDCTTMLCGMGGSCRKCVADGDCFPGATCLAGSCVGEGGYHGPGGNGNGTSGGTGGGNGTYDSCNECTHVNTGAYWHQCDSLRAPCMANPICSSMLACSLNGLQSWPGGQTTKPPCTTNAEGAACTIECVDFYKNQDAQAATLYYQLDACVYCATCSTLCEDDTVSAMNYCNGICAAPEANCQ